MTASWKVTCLLTLTAPCKKEENRFPRGRKQSYFCQAPGTGDRLSQDTVSSSRLPCQALCPSPGSFCLAGSSEDSTCWKPSRAVRLQSRRPWPGPSLFPALEGMLLGTLGRRCAEVHLQDPGLQTPTPVASPKLHSKPKSRRPDTIICSMQTGSQGSRLTWELGWKTRSQRSTRVRRPVANMGYGKLAEGPQQNEDS